MLLRDEIEGSLLLFGKQRLPFLALAPNFLNQLGKAHQLRLNGMDILFHALLAQADMPQLIVKNNHIRQQLFHRLGNNRDCILYRLPQLLDCRFQLTKQSVICLDLTVNFASVRDDALFLQRLRCHTFMDGRNLIQPPCSVAAVVNAFLPPGAFQTAVGHICPCCPPCRKLFFAVPALGDRILSAVAGAFGMRVSPDKPLCFGIRRCHIHLLFADLVGILLLPAVVLRRPELSGSKTAFLAVFHAEIFLLSLVLPVSLPIQRAHRQENVGMRVVTVGVVDGCVGAHSIGHKLLPDKVLQQLNLLFTA